MMQKSISWEKRKQFVICGFAAATASTPISSIESSEIYSGQPVCTVQFSTRLRQPARVSEEGRPGGYAGFAPEQYEIGLDDFFGNREIICGTGGDGHFSELIARDTTDHATGAAGEYGTPLSNATMISEIRSALSLQVSELARALRVQRPTIYSWIKGDAEPTQPNRERLQKLYGFARFWNEISQIPIGRNVVQLSSSCGSILDMLTAGTIDELTVKSRLDELAKVRATEQESGERARPTSRSLMEKHGFAPGSVADNQHLIDAETGQRYAPE